MSAAVPVPSAITSLSTWFMRSARSAGTTGSMTGSASYRTAPLASVTRSTYQGLIRLPRRA
jgi:hypothetical protein